MKELTITKEKVQQIVFDKLPEVIEKEFEDSYSSSNFVRKIIEQEIKTREGALREIVKDILDKIIKDDKFKARLGDHVILRVIEKAFN